jgi:hypothetical protein
MKSLTIYARIIDGWVYRFGQSPNCNTFINEPQYILQKIDRSLYSFWLFHVLWYKSRFFRLTLLFTASFCVFVPSVNSKDVRNVLVRMKISVTCLQRSSMSYKCLPVLQFYLGMNYFKQNYYRVSPPSTWFWVQPCRVICCPKLIY